MGCGCSPATERQVSDALGAAGSQLGARAVGLAVLLNKQCGVSPGNIAELYGHLGVEVTASGIVHAVARAARRAAPTYQALCGRDPGLSGGVTG